MAALSQRTRLELRRALGRRWHPDSRAYGCRFASRHRRCVQPRVDRGGRRHRVHRHGAARAAPCRPQRRCGSGTVSAAVVPARPHCGCACSLDRRCRNCRVERGRTGHRSWRHNRDEHRVVIEFLAHCDIRLVGTAPTRASTPTPSPGARTCASSGTPPYCNPNVGTSGVATPSGGTGSSAASSASAGPGVKVRRTGEAAFVSITNSDKPPVGCVAIVLSGGGSRRHGQLQRADLNFTVTGSEEARLPIAEWDLRRARPFTSP